MKLLRLAVRILLALFVLLSLAAVFGYFYIDYKLNPYDMDSYSGGWDERFRTQPAGWAPAPGHLMTRWAKEVTPEHAWPEYPRPQMRRKEWLNLNGIWEIAVVRRQQDRVHEFPGRILVPFPIESALSGVKQPLLPGERLWYRRSFTLPKDWSGRKMVLHFGAVDWEAQVWVNGIRVGVHQGGYDPFSFEISSHVKPDLENELVVAAWDPTNVGPQEAGKQRLVPHTAFYTPASGIWQTVWLEPVPRTYIERLRIVPDIDAERVALTTEIQGNPDGTRVVAKVIEGGKEIAKAAGPIGDTLELGVPRPKLWSPDSPYLYDLCVSVEQDGRVVDEIESYFGMRKFSLGKDAGGIPRLFVNNRPLFQFGPLDQGYWPDGIYTAPTDEALRYDIEMAKKLGFNMIRKHVKVEPARWYYHCDRLGMIVWQDMPSSQPKLRALVAFMLGREKKDDDYTFFGREDPIAREGYRRNLRVMIDSLYNAPSVAVWVPFNESWGQFDARQIADWIKQYDSSRLVNHASGWFDQGAGDIKDLHIYSRPLTIPDVEPTRAIVLGEIGGLGLLDPQHAWQQGRLFMYDRSQSKGELTAKYLRLLNEQVIPLVAMGLSAAVYTQITDVEGEVNGLLTYDREVVKMDSEQVARVNRKLVGNY